jgi:hypothetical protein
MFISLYFIQTTITNGRHALSCLILTAVISPRKIRDLKDKRGELVQCPTGR